MGFVSPRLGKKPEVKTPRVRKSAWTHLVGLASTQDQLEKVVELLPKWKDMGCEFGDKFGDLIARAWFKFVYVVKLNGVSRTL